MRAFILPLLLPGLLLGGCRAAAPRRPALKANEVPNKRIITESPTLEKPSPVKP